MASDNEKIVQPFCFGEEESKCFNSLKTYEQINPAKYQSIKCKMQQMGGEV